MTIDEFIEYKQFPDTFFGVHKRKNNTAKTPLELYDFIYNSYKNTPKDKLLELMEIQDKNHKYNKLSQEEILKIYSEGVVNNLWKNK